MVDHHIPLQKVASRFNPWYEVAGFGIPLMEAAWTVLIFQSMSQATANTSTVGIFVYFAATFYIAYQMMRAFQEYSFRQMPARVSLLAVYVLLTWLGGRLLLPLALPSNFDPFTTNLRGIGEVTELIPARIWLSAALLWLFLRGSVTGRQGVGTYAVQRNFKFGVVMFLLYSVFAFTQVRELPGLGVFVVFLFATLLSMAAARVSILGRLRGGRRNPFSRGWFGSMAAAVAGTVGAGLSLAMLATGRFLLFYRQVVSGLFIGIVSLTLAPFILFLGLFSSTPINPLPEEPQGLELPPWERDTGLSFDFAQTSSEQMDIIPPDLRVYYYWGLTALAIIIVLSLFFGIRTISRRRQTVEKVEYLYQRGDLLDQLRREFEKRRKQVRDAWFGSNPLAKGQQIIAAARIRRIYTEMIQMAADFGIPRDPAQTPLEFSGVLQFKIPEVKTAIHTITSAYLRIRYGELPEHAEEVRQVENAWSDVQKIGVEKVKLYKLKRKEEERARKRKEKRQ